jgi:hypothetical protein
LSEPIKLLLDECLGWPLVESINSFLSWDLPPPTIRHLFSYFKAGTCDSVWIPAVADEGWIILTADRARKSSLHKLPAICHQYKITHILMGPSILRLKQNQKAAAIVSVWDDIKKCGDAPPGSRFILRLNSNQKPTIIQVHIEPTS